MQSAYAVVYCQLWPFQRYYIFPQYLIIGMILGKCLLTVKCVLIFSTTFVWNISQSKKNSARYHKCSSINRYSCQIVITPYNLLDIFSQNNTFHESRPVGIRVVPSGLTANGRFSQFSERAYKYLIWYFVQSQEYSSLSWPHCFH